MSGIFKFNGDKNSPQNKPSLSSPASLTTPTRPSRLGLFMGVQDSASMMETSFSSLNANNVQQQSKASFTTTTTTNCPSSPAQGRSLREFEEQMASLRKENFNLKLRIYFLEEKPSPSHHALANSSSCPNIDSIESISKQNIDLKVENESLRKELQEKQELLCQASKAMELMENQHKKENIDAQMIIEDLNHRIEAMTHEMKKFEKALIESSRNHDTGFSDFLGAIDAKDVEAQRKIAEFEIIMRSFSEQNEQLCQKIEKMELERVEMTRKFNQLNYENSELKEKLEETLQYSDKDEIKKLQDECYESKRRLADAISKLDDTEKKFLEKSEAHEKSLQVIQKACEHIEDLELHVEQLKSSQPNSLSSTESAKNDDNFSHANGLIVKLRHQVEQITVEKNDEINRLKEELQKKSRMTFTPLCNSSVLTSATQSILQSINFPTNESSFNEIIEKNRNAQKKIHFLKQKLSSNDIHNKIENEFLQLQLKEAQSELHESESALRQSVNFCGILLIRLEELVKFLNSLLQKKDIGGLLGYELKKAITRAVDRSFNLSQSINLNQSNSMNLSEMSMIDLVDSLASSTVADSMIDSLRSDSFQLKTENDSNKLMKTSNVSGSKGHRSLKNTKKSLVSVLLKQQSESEEWSEPDRDISKERIGLSTADESMLSKPIQNSTSDEDDENDVGSEHKLVRKAEWKLIHEKIKSLENLLQEKNDKILEVSGMLLDAENDAKDKILQIKKKLDETEKEILHYKNLYQQVTNDKCELSKSLQERESTIENLKNEKDRLNVELKVLSSKYESQVDINREIKCKFQEEEEKLQKLHVEYETKCKTYEQLVNISEKREQAFKDELQQNWIRKTIYNQLLQELEKKQERLKDYQRKFGAMEEEMKTMHGQVLEGEERFEKISRNLDTATLQLSTASVERSKALNEKRTLENKLKKLNEDYQKLNIEKQEANLKIADLEVFNAKLQNKLLIGGSGSDKLTIGTHLSDASGYASEDANALRSASFSSTDDKELSLDAFSNCSSCKKLANEMNEIRKNLHQSKRSLEQAYSKLRNQNLRKAQIEMDIKQQIVKTQNVLQTVRTNMELELNRGSSRKEESN